MFREIMGVPDVSHLMQTRDLKTTGCFCNYRALDLDSNLETII